MDKLKRMFKKRLLEMYTKKVVNDNLYNIEEEEVEEFCKEHASDTAESLTRDCISLINSKDWNAPKNNLYTFDFAMKAEHNITTKEQLLSRDDAAEIVFAWFWSCFGSYNLIYNFTDDLNEYCNEFKENCIC